MAQQAQRVSLSTPVLMSALFTYHNFTILLKACNSIFYEIAHAILLQLIHICFFFNLLQCLIAGCIHIAVFGIFKLYHDAGSVVWNFNEDIAVACAPIRCLI